MSTTKYAVVLGAGGFIGHHLVNRLKKEGYWVRGVDIKYPEFSISTADDFVIADLRNENVYDGIFSAPNAGIFHEVYQLAADMGGAGYLFTGEHDANILRNSALINMHTAFYCFKHRIKKVFFSSSACVYPERNQMDPENPMCSEDSVYPAAPESEYGWEKLFAERMYSAFARNYNLEVRIARFHNIFGEESTYDGGKEKAPAALCRKIAKCEDGGTIEVWGDGEQTRSYLHVDECVEGVRILMESDCKDPVNIGSEELISVNNLVAMIAGIAGKKINIVHIKGPQGVRGRNSDNRFIQDRLNWAPSRPLLEGMTKAYTWINEQLK